jgi:fumarate hydratase class II
LPIGLKAAGKPHESDSLGGIDVLADHYRGAQTQRSLRRRGTGLKNLNLRAATRDCAKVKAV